MNALLTTEWRAKLCDYGMCVHEDSDERLEFYGGTEEYSAPELILAQDYKTFSVETKTIWMAHTKSTRLLVEPAEF